MTHKYTELGWCLSLVSLVNHRVDMLFSTRAFIAASIVFGSSVNAVPGSGPAVLGAPVKISGSVVYNVSAEHKHLFDFQHKNLAKRSCASDYNTAALNTAAAMQSLYYNSGGWYQGGSGGGSAWTDVVRALYYDISLSC